MSRASYVMSFLLASLGMLLMQWPAFAQCGCPRHKGGGPPAFGPGHGPGPTMPGTPTFFFPPTMHRHHNQPHFPQQHMQQVMLNIQLVHMQQQQQLVRFQQQMMQRQLMQQLVQQKLQQQQLMQLQLQQQVAQRQNVLQLTLQNLQQQIAQQQMLQQQLTQQMTQNVGASQPPLQQVFVPPGPSPEQQLAEQQARQLIADQASAEQRRQVYADQLLQRAASDSSATPSPAR